MLPKFPTLLIEREREREREREGNTLVKKKSNTVLSSMAVPEPITYNTGSCLSPSKCFESQFLGEATITPENLRPELTNQLG